MATPEKEITGTWEEILQHSEELVGKRVRLTVLSAHEQPPAAHKPIEQVIQDLAAQVPAEEWAKVPKDLSANLDHYLYGSPKKP